MKKLDLNDVREYVSQNIGLFHFKRIEKLKKLKLNTTLKRKNPYLFKAKNVLTANELITGITDAYVSSSEETLFGDWLEGLAIFINKQVYNGIKSGIQSIDLEFSTNNIRYIVNIKSGPNWGNSSQIKKMKADFKTAKKTLRTSNSNLNIRCINGCCYGTDNKPDKGDYFKYCGQRFWHFISGEEDLYQNIIEPIGYKSKEKNEAFQKEYAKLINRFTLDFGNEFCYSSGAINWDKLVAYNSGS